MTETLEQAFASFPFRVAIDVRWGDMDAYQHVNNAMYFRYMETARIAWFDQTTVRDALGSDGIGPVLRDTSCSFDAPVTHPDTLHIGVRMEPVPPPPGRDANRFMSYYAMYSEQQQRIVARGTALVVMMVLDTGRPVPLPPAFADLIERGGAIT